MKEYKKSILYGSGIVSMFIVAMLIATQVTVPFEKESLESIPKEWTEVAALGNSPQAMAGGGKLGIVGIWIIGHLGNPAGQYDTNLTVNATMYAYETTHFNKSLGGNVPPATAFDIVITVRLLHENISNASVFQMGVGSIPDNTTDWARMNLTCLHTTPIIDQGGGTPLRASGRRNISDQALGDPIDGYYNFWWNNSGSGYTIGAGVSANASVFTLEIFQ